MPPKSRKALEEGKPVLANDLHRPAEVAKALHCSEWWVKEQARRRRIPFAWIGGSYLFTDSHVAEIIRLFEVRPTCGNPVSGEPERGQPLRGTRSADPVVRLRAKPPRRALKVHETAA